MLLYGTYRFECGNAKLYSKRRVARLSIPLFKFPAHAQISKIFVQSNLMQYQHDIIRLGRGRNRIHVLFFISGAFSPTVSQNDIDFWDTGHLERPFFLQWMCVVQWSRQFLDMHLFFQDPKSPRWCSFHYYCFFFCNGYTIDRATIEIQGNKI